MKKHIFTAVTIVIAYLLQTVICPHIALANITPNLMIIIVIFFALIRGQREGMIIGIICGFLMDISGDVCLGLNTLILMYCGFGVGSFKDRIYPDDFKIPVFITAITDFFCGSAVYVIYTIAGRSLSLTYYMNSVIIPETVYSMVAAIPVYILLLNVQQAIDRQKDKGAIKL